MGQKERNYLNKEETRFGERPFPDGTAGTCGNIRPVYCGIEECRPDHSFGPFTREEYLIHFVLDGCGVFRTPEDRFRIEAGQMFLIYPGTETLYRADHIRPWSYCWIGFKGLRTEPVLKRCGFSRGNLIQPLLHPREVLACIQEILSRRTLAASDMLARESSMIRLFSILARDYEDATGDLGLESDSRDALYARLGREYIRGVYMHSSLTVEDIAAHIGVTRARLNRAFQKEMGTSIQQYLIECRLCQAASLLRKTSLSVKEITWQCGYSDQLVFSAAFKKKYGLSPTTYRAEPAE